MSDQHQTCSPRQEHISGGNILEAFKKQIYQMRSKYLHDLLLTYSLISSPKRDIFLQLSK